MNALVIACHSTMEKTAYSWCYARIFSLGGCEGEYGSGDPGSGFIVDGGRITSSCDYF